MAKKFTGRCKFSAQFPASKTRADATIQLGELHAVEIASHLVPSFRRIIAAHYADPAKRPILKKLTITISLP